MKFRCVRCRQEYEYQQRFATLLAEGQEWREMPNVLATDLLCLPEDLGHLYFVEHRAYWSKELHFEARVRDRHGVFSAWQSMELFSIRVSYPTE